ncbi:aspartate-semialdehyde dehydrogenase [Irregularibacter muris]|uniref:Aspartate-semialdehyde dehydrogenase n=1 Tax=Irregularibacter muris TaxID=1796619 RepID=A0AAE3HHQ4_9FIRM|nr:aspartate-semialdehyde dehydrogenase [Irregularibacter muris]MCR1899782.1 aspartate-semialdehyde dehydrogenase [Irregularibacter muris]
MHRKLNVALVGATGMVGRKILEILEERNFPINNLHVLASSRSVGLELDFRGKKYIVNELNAESFNHVDLAFFAAGGAISEVYVPTAVSKGVIIIDNSSVFRMDPSVPLIVPEVNPEAVMKNKGILANPNCSTIQAVLPLKALHHSYKIKRVVFSTYQAVSGSGTKGYKDLQEGIKGNNPEFYPHPIAFNCIPHIDYFLKNGYTKEEMKMMEETKKILNDHSIGITATTVRVPVFYGHSESINIEFEKAFKMEEVREILRDMPGIILLDEPSDNIYPLASFAQGKDEVFVGRLRKDESVEYGLNLWVVADNIRKGAATNAVQIAELLLEKDLIGCS